MERKWLKYTNRHTSGRRTSAPSVSVLRSGKLGLNLGAFELLGRPEAVVLLYDEENQAIGLQAATTGERNAYAVSRRGKWQSWRVSGAAFLSHYGIPFGEEPLSFAAHKEGAVLVVSLRAAEKV